MGKNHLFGDTIKTIGIAAPASSCELEKLRAGILFLEKSGVNVISGKNLFRKGTFSYLSADDSFRIDDFNSLAENPAVDAILCARGGYGTLRILNEINYSVLKERNLPVIGFSDITALHLAMFSRKSGVCIASQMAARFPEAAENAATLSGMKRVYRRLAGKSGNFRKVGRNLSALNGETEAAGGIIPVNLTLAAALCGTGFLPQMAGKIIVLEEVGEPVRKIDRMLYQLFYSGVFDHASAVVFAQFTDCGEQKELKKLFRDFSEKTDFPVFSGLEYGHALPSQSFLFDELCRRC